MARATNTQAKRTRAPRTSIFQSAPAQVMIPRLMVGLSALALLALGLVMVYSASSITAYVEQGSSLGETLKQCGFAALGIVAAAFAAKYFRADAMRGRLGWVFYVVCMVGLVLTFVMGTVGLGAKRWLYLGPVSLQISEFAKIAFVIVAAGILDDYNRGALTQEEALYRALGFVVVPLGFLFITQSDLGTTFIIVAALVLLLWFSGRPTKLLLVIVALVVVGVAIAVVTQGYRSDRLIFLDPWSDPDDTGYQLIHSFKALSAGGLFGVGIGNSYEKLQYLPEAETDFIFAIVGEELGLLGACFVVLLFLVFLRGGFKVAKGASNSFGSLVAAGLSVMLVFQAFLNIMCVIGLLPTTGKPLPFMSSGGSSLISSLFLVGIVLAISFESHDESAYRQRREGLRVVSSARASNRRGSTVETPVRSRRPPASSARYSSARRR